MASSFFKASSNGTFAFAELFGPAVFGGFGTGKKLSQIGLRVQFGVAADLAMAQTSDPPAKFSDKFSVRRRTILPLPAGYDCWVLDSVEYMHVAATFRPIVEAGSHSRQP
jgi:hypothetical protein